MVRVREDMRGAAKLTVFLDSTRSPQPDAQVQQRAGLIQILERDLEQS